jgi:hypothetical protein
MRFLQLQTDETFSSVIESEKDKIIREKLNSPRQEGWHWVDDRIIGKRPLLTKDIFMALLEKIN